MSSVNESLLEMLIWTLVTIKTCVISSFSTTTTKS